MKPLGQPGTRELFDTGDEVIGIYIDRFGDRAETTRGLIHYGEGGTHIIPAAPRPKPRQVYDHSNSSQAMRDVILWCLDSELRSALDALSFSFDPFTRTTKGIVELRAHIAAPPTAMIVDEIQIFESLLLSHEVDWFAVGHDIEVEGDPARRSYLPHLAWTRTS